MQGREYIDRYYDNHNCLPSLCYWPYIARRLLTLILTNKHGPAELETTGSCAIDSLRKSAGVAHITLSEASSYVHPAALQPRRCSM